MSFPDSLGSPKDSAKLFRLRHAMRYRPCSGRFFAKIVSTANNFLFSPATNLIHDIYERFINPRATERQILLVSRLVVVALGLFALLQATNSNRCSRRLYTRARSMARP